MVRLDFETRSELDVKDVGSHIYAKHPSTDVLCVAWSVDDGPINLWHPFSGKRDIPVGLAKALYSDKHKVGNARGEAHNKKFEEDIWFWVMQKKYDWPALPPLDCTAAMAALMSLPRSLEELGRALKLKKQKDLEGKRIMLKCTKPRRATKADPDSKWHEKPEDLNRVFSYCKDDVASEREASYELEPLPVFERRVWQMDQRINRRGVHIDREGVESALFLLEGIVKQLTEELRQVTDGRIQTVGQTVKILDYLADQGTHLPNLQKATVEEALKEGGHTPGAQRVLEIRSKLNKASTKKYDAMLARMDTDNRVRDILLYAGASTGRWAGSGIQIQNLPKGTDDDQETCIEIMKLRDLELFQMCYADPMKAISSVIRGMICAPEGKIIRAFDYNAIEVRVLFWLSDCKLGLQEYHDKVDLYKAMASIIFNKPISEITDYERFVGKTAVLGCGYGMGAKKYDMTNGVGPEVAQKAVTGYRSRYKEVPKFWKALETAAFECVVKGDGASAQVGKLFFQMHKKFLTITLPSGRRVFYWYPSIKQTMSDFGPREQVHFWYVDSQKKKWVEGSIWGGTWAENVCQAVAREVMVPAMLDLEIHGYTPLFSVHDEIVTEDDIGFGSLKEMESIMLELEPWAKGLPIAVGGWERPRYKK